MCLYVPMCVPQLCLTTCYLPKMCLTNPNPEPGGPKCRTMMWLQAAMNKNVLCGLLRPVPKTDCGQRPPLRRGEGLTLGVLGPVEPPRPCTPNNKAYLESC